MKSPWGPKKISLFSTVRMSEEPTFFTQASTVVPLSLTWMILMSLFIRSFSESLALVIAEPLRWTTRETSLQAPERALLRDDGRSTLIVEYGDYYSEK